MQESSVSSRLPASAPTEAKHMSRYRTWVQAWHSVWRLQRSYLPLTLLMFVAVGFVAALLWLFALWIFPPGVPDALATTFQWQLLLACVLIAVVLSATFVIALQINARHVRQATVALARLAKGDVAARTELEVSAGEIGQLNRAVNRLGERMERHSLQLVREHERFDAVLNAMTDGVLILDRRGAVTLINPAACRLLQNDPAHSLRQSFVQVVRDYRIADVWQQSVQRQIERSATVEVSPGYFLRISVIPFQDGSTNGFLVLIQDQSNAHRLEAVRRDLVSNISHELRTPLASIKALVDTLRDGAMSDPPAAERFLERMEVEVDSMTQMIQELLELSRIESGQAPLRLFPIALDNLILPVVERLRPQAMRAGLTLTVVIPEDLPQVMVDADRIRQVVVNLVHNAIKFTPSGGFVTVSARAVSDAVIISVADTGTGIPREDQPRIFERFYKADRARSGGGTGLGLAIAKHTMQAHNGRIWVESVEGKGSTFSFSLPLVNIPFTNP